MSFNLASQHIKAELIDFSIHGSFKSSSAGQARRAVRPFAGRTEQGSPRLSEYWSPVVSKWQSRARTLGRLPPIALAPSGSVNDLNTGLQEKA